jgi:polyhydroxyalkanoate synthesis repressor PhaR
MSAPKIVKRYANRKLYDTERSCYVTLEDISVMIKTGEEVKVVDNKSGEDLTSVTLAQIIFETEKKNNFMPLSLLRGLIQDSGGAIGEFARGRVEQVTAKAQEVKESASKLKSEWEDRLNDAMGKGEGPSGDDKEPTVPRASLVTELVASSKGAFEELQKSVEEKIKGPVGAVARYASVGRDMEEIRRRMAELEQRLEKFPQ